MKLEDRPIGEVLEEEERGETYELIVGGVSWPARGQGYAVILGVGRDSNFEPYRAYVLDEYQDYDLCKLEPVRWA
jgi:hypothetical protein